MPATSAKQKRFMDAAAHNPEFAKAAGVPVSVAKEFSKESKGMKFGKGSKPELQRADGAIWHNAPRCRDDFPAVAIARSDYR